MSDRFNVNSPFSAFVDFTPLATPEWESWEHGPVQKMDMSGPTQTLSLWNNSINQERPWPLLDERVEATQAIPSAGIQDPMPVSKSRDPSSNWSQFQAQQVKCTEPIWCPTPPSPKLECQECQFQKLCHKRSKDKMYRRMQRSFKSALVKKDKEIHFLRKRVTELEQVRCK